MAKTVVSNVPKVMSKANREISSVIESDIALESQLLKELVDKVLSSNLDVKKRSNQRITETKRKLAELDDEIKNLNISIDLVDRDTVIQQLNEMIDAENNIFKARLEIRFFKDEKAQDRLEAMNKIYTNLLESVQNINIFEEKYRDGIVHSNNLLFNKQVELTRQVILIMEDFFEQKRDFTKREIIRFSSLSNKIIKLEDEFNHFIEKKLESCVLIRKTSSSFFTDKDDDAFMNEKITQEHEDKLLEFENSFEYAKEIYEDKKNQVNQELLKFKNVLETNNQPLIVDDNTEVIDEFSKEVTINTEVDEAIEDEKTSQLETETEKVIVKTDFTSIKEQLKIHKKLLKKLKILESGFAADSNKNQFSVALENVMFDEAKMLYRMKSDFAALQNDMLINKDVMFNMEDYLNSRVDVRSQIVNFKLELRIAELQIIKDNEILELNLIEKFNELLADLDRIEHLRIIALRRNLNDFDLVKIEQDYQLQKSIHEMKLDCDLADFEKLIAKKRNETLVKYEKIKEEANSKIIYQESLINIAKKEHELQLIKVKALYENERILAEEQIDRINSGIKVNDAFVKTTLENQLLFADQQIKCATSEYDIRVESINLTRSQELDYAYKKINYFKHKYDYDITKVKKELEEKLEDLDFKLLLYTDEKDNLEIKSKIKAIKSKYNKMIKKIRLDESKDEDILRYQKVIDAANLRADEAIAEAAVLRDQTIDSFSGLYDKTKNRYELLDDVVTENSTKVSVPALSSTAVSSANDRLQRAIKEADELYNEKIILPLSIIKETKAFLDVHTYSEDTNDYINSQKEFRRVRITECIDLLDNLVIEKDKNIRISNEEFERQIGVMIVKLDNIKSSLQNVGSYKTVAIIEKDFEKDKQKEIEKHNDYIKKLDDFMITRLMIHEKVHNENNAEIRLTIKPYKKYIKLASKGVNAKRKVLSEQYKSRLKGRLIVIKKNFKKQINEIKY